MITTTKSLLTFLAYAKQYIARFPNERSQLTFALNSKYINKLKKWHEEVERTLNDKKEELEGKYCVKDEKTQGFLEREVFAGNQIVFKKHFTEDGDKKRKEEYDKFEEKILSESFEFQEYVVPVPPLIDISWVEAFSGFVFKEMGEEEMEKWYLAQEEQK